MAQNRNTRGKKRKMNKAVIIVPIVIILIFAVLLGAVYFYFSNKLQNNQYPQKYGEYVEKASKEYDLDKSLIYAVIRTESKFNENAESRVGACGLMQIMPETFETYMNIRDESGKYTTDDLFNPAINIDYGCYILRDLLNEYDGNEECAVAAYNAGSGNVDSWLSDPNISPDGQTLIVSNIPDSFSETRSYVISVEEAKETYQDLLKN